MKRFGKLSLALLLMTFAATMFATQPSATIAVTANINSSCVITANPLAFGNYDPLVGNKTADLDAQTNITVQCVDEMNATVSLDQGLYPASGSTPAIPLRQLQCEDQDDPLAYFLYADASHTTVWGSDTSTQPLLADGTPHDYTIYGVIPHGQMGEAEAYSDTVTATVIY